MATDLHVGDEGATLRITITDTDGNGRDISGATEKEIKVRSPTGDSKTLTATFTNSGTDGKIEADTTADTLHEDGSWSIQGRVKDGGSWHTDMDTFDVEETL